MTEDFFVHIKKVIESEKQVCILQDSSNAIRYKDSDDASYVHTVQTHPEETKRFVKDEPRLKECLIASFLSEDPDEDNQINLVFRMENRVLCFTVFISKWNQDEKVYVSMHELGKEESMVPKKRSFTMESRLHLHSILMRFEETIKEMPICRLHFVTQDIAFDHERTLNRI